MSFRKFGGTQYSSKHNYVHSQNSNINQLQIIDETGQLNSKQVSLSHYDLSGNSLLNVKSIYFYDGSKIESSTTGVTGAQGPKGDPGEPGPQGPPGIQGPPGTDGTNGKDGTDGTNGKDGTDGTNGKDGTDGAPGPPGAPGDSFWNQNTDGSVYTQLTSFWNYYDVSANTTQNPNIITKITNSTQYKIFICENDPDYTVSSIYNLGTTDVLCNYIIVMDGQNGEVRNGNQSDNYNGANGGKGGDYYQGTHTIKPNETLTYTYNTMSPPTLSSNNGSIYLSTPISGTSGQLGGASGKNGQDAVLGYEFTLETYTFGIAGGGGGGGGYFDSSIVTDGGASYLSTSSNPGGGGGGHGNSPGLDAKKGLFGNNFYYGNGGGGSGGISYPYTTPAKGSSGALILWLLEPNTTIAGDLSVQNKITVNNVDATTVSAVNINADSIYLNNVKLNNFWNQNPDNSVFTTNASVISLSQNVQNIPLSFNTILICENDSNPHTITNQSETDSITFNYFVVNNGLSGDNNSFGGKGGDYQLGQLTLLPYQHITYSSNGSSPSLSIGNNPITLSLTHGQVGSSPGQNAFPGYELDIDNYHFCIGGGGGGGGGDTSSGGNSYLSNSFVDGGGGGGLSNSYIINNDDGIPAKTGIFANSNSTLFNVFYGNGGGGAANTGGDTNATGGAGGIGAFVVYNFNTNQSSTLAGDLIVQNNVSANNVSANTVSVTNVYATDSIYANNVKLNSFWNQNTDDGSVYTQSNDYPSISQDISINQNSYKFITENYIFFICENSTYYTLSEITNTTETLDCSFIIVNDGSPGEHSNPNNGNAGGKGGDYYKGSFTLEPNSLIQYQYNHSPPSSYSTLTIGGTSVSLNPLISGRSGQAGGATNQNGQDALPGYEFNIDNYHFCIAGGGGGGGGTYTATLTMGGASYLSTSLPSGGGGGGNGNTDGLDAQKGLFGNNIFYGNGGGGNGQNSVTQNGGQGSYGAFIFWFARNVKNQSTLDGDLIVNNNVSTNNVYANNIYANDSLYVNNVKLTSLWHQNTDDSVFTTYNDNDISFNYTSSVQNITSSLNTTILICENNPDNTYIITNNGPPITCNYFVVNDGLSGHNNSTFNSGIGTNGGNGGDYQFGTLTLSSGQTITYSSDGSSPFISVNSNPITLSLLPGRLGQPGGALQSRGQNALPGYEFDIDNYHFCIAGGGGGGAGLCLQVPPQLKGGNSYLSHSFMDGGGGGGLSKSESTGSYNNGITAKTGIFANSNSTLFNVFYGNGGGGAAGGTNANGGAGGIGAFVIWNISTNQSSTLAGDLYVQNNIYSNNVKLNNCWNQNADGSVYTQTNYPAISQNTTLNPYSYKFITENHIFFICENNSTFPSSLITNSSYSLDCAFIIVNDGSPGGVPNGNPDGKYGGKGGDYFIGSFTLTPGSSINYNYLPSSSSSTLTIGGTSVSLNPFISGKLGQSGGGTDENGQNAKPGYEFDIDNYHFCLAGGGGGGGGAYNTNPTLGGDSYLSSSLNPGGGGGGNYNRIGLFAKKGVFGNNIFYGNGGGGAGAQSFGQNGKGAHGSLGAFILWFAKTAQNQSTLDGDLYVQNNVNATNVYASTAVYANHVQLFSDYRIKNQIKSIHDMENMTVDYLKPIYYENTLVHKYDIGFLAHEVQQYFPSLVTGNKDGSELQTINYIGLIPILVKEIQLLKNRVQELEDEKDQNE